MLMIVYPNACGTQSISHSLAGIRPKWLSLTGSGVFLYVACTELGPQVRKNPSYPTPSDPTVEVVVSCCLHGCTSCCVYKGSNDLDAYIMRVTIVLFCFVRYWIATARNVESIKFDGTIQRQMCHRFVSALQVIFIPFSWSITVTTHFPGAADPLPPGGAGANCSHGRISSMYVRTHTC